MDEEDLFKIATENVIRATIFACLNEEDKISSEELKRRVCKNLEFNVRDVDFYENLNLMCELGLIIEENVSSKIENLKYYSLSEKGRKIYPEVKDVVDESYTKVKKIFDSYNKPDYLV